VSRGLFRLLDPTIMEIASIQIFLASDRSGCYDEPSKLNTNSLPKDRIWM
jgi:hypothetical protein